MIFDEDFKQLTGGLGLGGAREASDDVPEDETGEVKSYFVADTSNDSSVGTATDKKAPAKKRVYDKSSGDRWSSEYGNPGSDYVIESDLVTPKIEISKAEERPIIVLVDDDFDTLDLMKVYLQRDYEYKGFSGPREAIFYLNSHVPALVLIDSKIHTMKASTFMEIVRMGEANKNTKFVYTGTKEELSQIDWMMTPEYVIDSLQIPVSRKELQRILDLIPTAKAAE